MRTLANVLIGAALLAASWIASHPSSCANTPDPWECSVTLPDVSQTWPEPAPPCPGCDPSPWPDCTGPACHQG